VTGDTGSRDDLFLSASEGRRGDVRQFDLTIGGIDWVAAANVRALSTSGCRNEHGDFEMQQ